MKYTKDVILLIIKNFLFLFNIAIQLIFYRYSPIENLFNSTPMLLFSTNFYYISLWRDVIVHVAARFVKIEVKFWKLKFSKIINKTSTVWTVRFQIDPKFDQCKSRRTVASRYTVPMKFQNVSRNVHVKILVNI